MADPRRSPGGWGAVPGVRWGIRHGVVGVYLDRAVARGGLVGQLLRDPAQRRFPRLRVVGSPERRDLQTLRGYEHLPVALGRPAGSPALPVRAEWADDVARPGASARVGDRNCPLDPARPPAVAAGPGGAVSRRG